MTKNEIRTKYKLLRKQLSQTEVSELSLKIANRLIEMPIWDKRFYHIFLSIPRNNEVDTENILHLLHGKDKNIVVSRTDFAETKMHHFLLTDDTKIQINGFGIPEPEEGIEISTEKIEVVFVPLLAFDNNGHRIGYGKGFYDKFLSQCKPDTVKIGLSFFDPEPAFAEVYDSDIALDFCVTPDNTYRF